MTALLLFVTALSLQQTEHVRVQSDVSYRASCQAGVSSGMRLLGQTQPSVWFKPLAACTPRTPKPNVACGCEAGVAAAFEARGLKWGPTSRQATLVADAVADCHAVIARRR